MAIKKTRRSGVALIVVLGLVAILMIVSVAFTIHMRVERAGAANLRHAAIARQLVKGGLGAALMAIDKQAGVSAVPEWYDSEDVTSLTYNPFSKSNKVKGYLWRDTFISFDTNDTDNVTTRRDDEHTHGQDVSGLLNAALFSEEVEKYFPAGLAYRGYATGYLPKSNDPGATSSSGKWRPIIQPQWQPVFADTANDNVIGRYAFFVLDTTGMLDASSLTNSANSRWMGRDPGEMDVSLLPDVSNAKKFAQANAKNGTYETLAEFAALNPNISDCRSFNTFSDDPGPTNELVYIGGSAEEIKRHKKEIINAFYDCGLTAGEQYGAKDCEQARWAYLGLVDYVDDDGKMEEDEKVKPWLRPATEIMPLVSGFFAKVTVRAEHQHKRPKDSNEHWQDDKQNPVQVKFKADIRIPFVNPFVWGKEFETTIKGKSTLDVAGMCKVYNPETNSRFKRKEYYENGFKSKRMVGDDDDFILDIAGDYTKAANLVALPSNKTAADQLKLVEGVKVRLQVGGATYSGNALQHCFPPESSEFSRDDNGLTEGYGMFVDVYGVKFAENSPTDTSPPVVTGEPGNQFETITRVWETNILVWAEIVDPRFSCKAMSDDADSDILMRNCFRASHVDPDEVDDIPIRELKTRQTGFENFTDAEKFEKLFLESPDKAWGRNRKGDAHDFGWYFGWNGAREMVGIGPFAAYLLTHPKAVEELYAMPMDGIQKGSSPTETDTAEMKFRMYVANRPLQSVGELGYLPIGMWQTIRLYDYGDDFGAPPEGRNRRADRRIDQFSYIPVDATIKNESGKLKSTYFHPVLDHFSVAGDGVSVQGRVNLNTLNEYILATVFHNMPIASEDEDRTTPRKIDRGITKPEDMDSLNCLAEAILEYRGNPAFGGFTKLSDLGRIFGEPGDMFLLQDTTKNASLSLPVEAVANAMKNADWGEFERESIIRNSCGLFTMRGQTFIVVVKGESYSPPFGRKKQLRGGTSNAAKTAIAEVWRDSIPDAWGNHPMYVKFFKIIDD